MEDTTPSKTVAQLSYWFLPTLLLPDDGVGPAEVSSLDETHADVTREC